MIYRNFRYSSEQYDTIYRYRNDILRYSIYRPITSLKNRVYYYQFITDTHNHAVLIEATVTAADLGVRLPVDCWRINCYNHMHHDVLAYAFNPVCVKCRPTRLIRRGSCRRRQPKRSQLRCADRIILRPSLPTLDQAQSASDNSSLPRLS